jgi:RNA polymerase-binding transcription factor DksA
MMSVTTSNTPTRCPAWSRVLSAADACGTLAQIDEALRRLDAGKYGACRECGGEIAKARLRALPFAVRCQACERRREETQASARRLAAQHAGSLFIAAITV